jgi:hypothetical protein
LEEYNVTHNTLPVVCLVGQAIRNLNKTSTSTDYGTVAESWALFDNVSAEVNTIKGATQMFPYNNYAISVLERSCRRRTIAFDTLYVSGREK